MESACNVWEEDFFNEMFELVEETLLLNEVVLLWLEALRPKEDYVTNFSWK